MFSLLLPGKLPVNYPPRKKARARISIQFVGLLALLLAVPAQANALVLYWQAFFVSEDFVIGGEDPGYYYGSGETTTLPGETIDFELVVYNGDEPSGFAGVDFLSESDALNSDLFFEGFVLDAGLESLGFTSSSSTPGVPLNDYFQFTATGPILSLPVDTLTSVGTMTISLSADIAPGEYTVDFLMPDVNDGTQNWEASYVALPQITVIPEPSDYAALAGLLTLAVILVRRRRVGRATVDTGR